MKEKTSHTKAKSWIYNLFPKKIKPAPFAQHLLYFGASLILGLILLAGFFIYKYERVYRDRVYPGVSVGQIDFTRGTKADVTNYWLNRNTPFNNIAFTFIYEDEIATVSGSAFDIGFDATLSATQALNIGRTNNWTTDLNHKYAAWRYGINLDPLFRWKEDILNTTLDTLAQQIDIEPQNALFEFKAGRVTEFKPAFPGRVLDKETVKRQFHEQLILLSSEASPPSQIVFNLPVQEKAALIKTEDANNLGIKELIGSGESYFRGSIAGRVHNLTLGASRINGVLVSPGETFSFNQTVGDISAATGYKQAYVIKEGRTVLDDGGGICQVSTTLFRAVLNAGLSIVERHAHSYRVGYYEQGGWKPGFDATVFAPSYDLKFTNDTGHYILIQAKVHPDQMHMVFELYGVKDNRTVEISPVRLWDARSAPPDLYQDDPTLPVGTIKQVDWAAPGIKAAFDYKVKKDGQENKTTFFSNFIPWQAVYLRGVKPQ